MVKHLTSPPPSSSSINENVISFRFRPLLYYMMVFVWGGLLVCTLYSIVSNPFYTALFIILYRMFNILLFKYVINDNIRYKYCRLLQYLLTESLIDTTTSKFSPDNIHHLCILVNHGIFPIGGSLSYIRHAIHNGFRKSVALGAKELLWIPVLSTLFQLGGFDGLTRENLDYYMKNKYSIVCIPYGFQEAARTIYGQSHSVIKPGIFKFIIQHEYNVIVRFIDGDTKLFSTFHIPMPKFIKKFLHKYNIPTIGFYGYFGLPFPYIDQRNIIVETLPFQLNYDGTTSDNNDSNENEKGEKLNAEQLCEKYKELVLKYRPETVFHKD